MEFCTTIMEKKTKIQLLYDACRSVFSRDDRLPTFQQIQWLKSILDLFEAVDVGIDEFCSLHGFPASSPRLVNGLFCGQGVSEITYIHVHECNYFSIGIFCFPAGGVFPLHDHPGMTVLSKLLYGSMYVKAYDWVKVDHSGHRTRGVGCRVMNGIQNAPCEASILFARSGGNIHSFTAITPCAVLDVLSPPYSQDLTRPSTYFSDLQIPSLPGYAMLEEIDMPDDFVVSGSPYLGPPVNTKEDLCNSVDIEQGNSSDQSN